MAVPEKLEFFIDPSRCIGCNACVQACTECDTHKGYSMIQLDYIDRSKSPQTVPLFACIAIRPRVRRYVLPMQSKKQMMVWFRVHGSRVALHAITVCWHALWNSQDEHKHEPDDEMRHVLRPYFERQEADVCFGMSKPGFVFWNT